MSWHADVLFQDTAQGEVLRFDAPISFWGGVNPVTSEVTLAGHPQRGQAIKDKILVLPQLIGSSSSSAVILELFYKGVAPKALILGGRDAILPVGVVVARQWAGRPFRLSFYPIRRFSRVTQFTSLRTGALKGCDTAQRPPSPTRPALAPR